MLYIALSAWFGIIGFIIFMGFAYKRYLDNKELYGR